MGGNVSNRTNNYLFGLTTKMLCYANMDYQKILNLLDTPNAVTLPADREKLLNHFYYSLRTFVGREIKLHKKHIKIHPKICINTQKDYDNYMEMLLYLHKVLDKGVTPKWMVTFHYSNSTDYIKPIKETDKELGFGDRYGYRCYGDLWKQNYYDKRRNDVFLTYKDAGQIRNVVLKCLYKIKRLNQTWKRDFPSLLFFHEKGKVKLQYHTHLLIPETKQFNCREELIDIFNTSIRKSRKCFSKWKKIDVREVNPNDKYDVVGYLNKETNFCNLSFDPYNSIIPVTN